LTPAAPFVIINILKEKEKSPAVAMADGADGPKATVALVSGGEGRRARVAAALAALGPALPERLQRARRVLVKPNFVSVKHPLSATAVDAARAVLDVVTAHARGEVIVGEGAALGETDRGFDAYGYRAVADEYGVPLVDLNRAPTVPCAVYDRNFRPLVVRLARPVVESDFRIAVGPPKSHDAVLVTLTVKNMAMGAVVRTAKGFGPGNDKWAIHQGYPAMNVNLFLVARAVWPHLGVIDGEVAMEGDGPIYGTPVPWGFAAASLDPLALDYTVCRMMGVAPEDVGYLSYCGRAGLGRFAAADIAVVGGGDPAALTKKIKLHSSAAEHYGWRLSDEKLKALTVI